MSSLKTTNLNMHKWEPADPVQRVEFNENFEKIDQHVNTVTDQLASKAQQVDLNLKADKTEVNSLASAKADKTYVDTITQSIASGSPKGSYSTLSALQTAFPTGNTNLYVVIADGKWYTWNGSAWTAGAVYLSSQPKLEILPSDPYDLWEGREWIIYVPTLSKVSSGKVWEWNELNLSELSVFAGVGTPGSVTVSNGEIVINDNSATDYWKVFSPVLTLPTDKYEIQATVKNPSTMAVAFYGLQGSTLKSFMMIEPPTNSFKWWTSGTSTVPETFAAGSYNDKYALLKGVYELGASPKMTPIFDGNIKTSVTDAGLTAINRIGLFTSNSHTGIGLAKDLVISKDRYVTVNGLKNGYKARINGVSVTETNGIATIDGKTIAWGRNLTLEILDGADTVIISLSPSEGIHGGDVYQLN